MSENKEGEIMWQCVGKLFSEKENAKGYACGFAELAIIERGSVIMEDTEMRELLTALMTMTVANLAGLSLAMLKLNYNDDVPRIREHITKQIEADTEKLN